MSASAVADGDVVSSSEDELEPGVACGSFSWVGSALGSEIGSGLRSSAEGRVPRPSGVAAAVVSSATGWLAATGAAVLAKGHIARICPMTTAFDPFFRSVFLSSIVGGASSVISINSPRICLST